MRSSNHYVIRNGRLVAKEQADKHNHQSQILPPAKINILKPIAVIVRSLPRQTHEGSTEKLQSHQVKDMRDESSLGKIKQYYENVIKNYEQKVQVLTKQVQIKQQIRNKNESIIRQNLLPISNQQQIVNCLDLKLQSFDYKKKCDYQIESTARETEGSMISSIHTQNQHKLNLSNDVVKLRCFVLSNQNKSDILRKPILSSLCLNSYVPESQSRDNSFCQTLNNNQQQSIQENQGFISRTICRIKQKCQSDEEGARKLTFFDTSRLMDRLNKSASLAKNIKRYLDPAASETIEQQNIFQTDSDSEYSSSTNGDQLRQFIAQLLQKHQKILQLVQQLSEDRENEIEQIHRNYQKIINKMVSSPHKNSDINVEDIKNLVKSQVKKGKQNLKVLTSICGQLSICSRIKQKGLSNKRKLKTSEILQNSSFDKERLPLETKLMNGQKYNYENQV